MTVIGADLLRLRICVVDSNPAQANATVALLQNAQFSSVTAFNSYTDFRDALRRMPPMMRRGYDLILISDNLRDTNTHDAIRMISGNTDFGYCGVMVVSNGPIDDFPTTYARCLRDGAIDVVHASYDRHQILSRIVLTMKLQHESSLRRIREDALETELAERKVMEARLKYLVAHDDLTGLANRRRLEQSLELAIIRSRNFIRNNALLYVDLDQFKVINDAEGHDVGDRLLIEVSRKLRNCIEGGDLIARIGSDEFAILIENINEEGAMARAECMRTELAEMEFHIGQVHYHVAASIGLVMNSPDEDITATQWLARADQACFIAKMQGRNTVYCFHGDDEGLQALRSDARWVPVIRKALAENRFFLVFQPIMDMSTWKISHYEALIRMRGENNEVFQPLDFIEVAERMGLIHQIDLWVVENVLDFLERLPPDQAHVSIGVNLSAHAFQDRALLPMVQKKLEISWINASRLIFEVTETAAIMNFNATRHMVTRLRALGCRFALDDFGSGFSSFNYIKNYPVDLLKIDGSFIVNISDDDTDLMLVRSMVEVAHGLGKKVIAEYVESEKILEILRGIGIDYVQGNYIGKPAVELQKIAPVSKLDKLRFDEESRELDDKQTPSILRNNSL
jgi:diguanylate cyclase (GGDEF)-like protein